MDGHETFTLKDDEYMVVGDFESMVKVRNEVLKNGQTIELKGKTYKPKFVFSVSFIIFLFCESWSIHFVS